MKRILIAISIALIIAISFGGAAVALSMFAKEVAGIGSMTFTDEVGIDDIKVKSLSEVRVTLVSKADCQADHVYTCYLYLDDVMWAVGQPATWMALEIPGTKIKVTFTGLDLGSVTDIEPEVLP